MLEGGENNANGISRKELNREIARLKRNKSTGKDIIENEALRFVGKGVREKIQRICNKGWTEKG